MLQLESSTFFCLEPSTELVERSINSAAVLIADLRCLDGGKPDAASARGHGKPDSEL